MQTRMTSTDSSTSSAARHKLLPRAGFTLVEMLVVVIIIAILAGMVLGLSKVGRSWQEKAVTAERLGRLRAAIEEFFAEYGKYPPVNAAYYGGQPFGYEYGWTNGMNVLTLNLGFRGADANKAWSEAPVFTFGLMSFLATRYTGRANNLDVLSPSYRDLLAMNQWGDFNLIVGDADRDREAIERWRVQIEGIDSTVKKARSVALRADASRTYPYTNLYFTVYDGWSKEFNYESRPPYISYRLWSNGPDGASGTADDVSTGVGY